MQEYISDPSRIVFACWEHKDITEMGDDVFRMAFRGQSFLSISIDMSVDIQLWTATDGTIQCKSVGYSVDDMAKLLGQVCLVSCCCVFGTAQALAFVWLEGQKC